MKRILFIHTHGGIGDLLLSAPAAEAMTRTWPDAEVTAWVRAGCRPLLTGHPAFSSCVTVDGQSLRAQLAALRRGRFDIAVLPWTTAREALLVWLAGIPVRVGQAGRVAYSWSFTRPVRVASADGDVARHWMDIQLDYARALGCRPDGVRPRLVLQESERADARALLERHGVPRGARPFCLHIGKGLPVTEARWPLERFAALGRLIRNAGCPLVLTGSTNERPVVQRLASEIGAGTTMLAGETTLRQLCAVIAESAVVLCPDSGPGHIAAALDVPVVSIFAVKSAPLERWRPWGATHRVVTTGEWACPRRCVKETCPRFDCLAAFDAADAARAAFELAAPAGTTFGRPREAVPAAS